METREDKQSKQHTTEEKALSMHNISNILLAVERLKELQAHETCRQRSDKISLGLDQLLRYYTGKHKEGLNKQWQTLITTFFHKNVHGGDQEGEEEEEGDLDDVASVVSSLDFEGFLEEVERSGTTGGAAVCGGAAGSESGATVCGGAASGESSQSQ